MEIIAFVLAVVAGALFIAEWARTRSLVALGLALLTAAWIVQLVVQTGSTVKVT